MYKGHEIAVHTLTHQDLTKLDKDTVYNEVFLDKQNLERMFGCQIPVWRILMEHIMMKWFRY